MESGSREARRTTAERDTSDESRHRGERGSTNQSGSTPRSTHPYVGIGRLSGIKDGSVGGHGRGTNGILAVNHPIEREADEIARVASTTSVRRSSPSGSEVKSPAGTDDKDGSDDTSRRAKQGWQPTTASNLRSPTTHGTTPDSRFAGSIAHVTGGGRPLPSSVRTDFESRFGTTLGDVRIHTSTAAGQLAAAAGARAFTHGNHVVFGPDEFRPHTAAGRHLLAHELAHVLQWRKGILGDGTIARMNNDGNSGTSSQQLPKGVFYKIYRLYGWNVCSLSHQLSKYGISPSVVVTLAENGYPPASIADYLRRLLDTLNRCSQQLSPERISQSITCFNEITNLKQIPEPYEKHSRYQEVRFGMPHSDPFTQSVWSIADSGASTRDCRFHIWMSEKIANNLGIEVPSADTDSTNSNCSDCGTFNNWGRVIRYRIKPMSATIGGQYYPTLNVAITSDHRKVVGLTNRLIKDWMIGARPSIVFRFTSYEQLNQLKGADSSIFKHMNTILPGEHSRMHVQVNRPSQAPAITSAGTTSSTPTQQQQQTAVTLLIDTGADVTALSDKMAFEKGLTSLDSSKFGWERTRDGIHMINTLDNILQKNNFPPIEDQTVEMAKQYLQLVANSIIDSPNQLRIRQLIQQPQLDKLRETLKRKKDENPTSGEYFWITETEIYRLLPDYTEFKKEGGKVSSDGNIFIPVELGYPFKSVRIYAKLFPHECLPTAVGALGQDVLKYVIVGPRGIGFEF